LNQPTEGPLGQVNLLVEPAIQVERLRQLDRPYRGAPLGISGDRLGRDWRSRTVDLHGCRRRGGTVVEGLGRGGRRKETHGAEEHQQGLKL
jgi:hypothetical protein